MRKLVITQQSKLKGFIYAKPGGGKTHFCGSAGLDERTAPVLYIDVGGNPITLHKALKKNAQIDVLQPDKLDELDAVHDWLVADQPMGTHLSKKYDLTRRYNTIVFDGITAIQRESFNTQLGAERHKFTEYFAKREYKHYGAVLQQSIHMAKLMYALDMHVLVTAQDHSTTRYFMPGDLSTAYEYHHPLLDGEAKTEFPGYALFVMRLVPVAVDPVTAKRCNAIYNFGSTEHNKFQYGKDQMGFNLGAGMGDPTITKLLDLLEK